MYIYLELTPPPPLYLTISLSLYCCMLYTSICTYLSVAVLVNRSRFLSSTYSGCQDGYENLEKNLASKGLFIEKTSDNIIQKKNDLNTSLEENTGYELYNDGTQYEYQR